MLARCINECDKKDCIYKNENLTRTPMDFRWFCINFSRYSYCGMEVQEEVKSSSEAQNEGCEGVDEGMEVKECVSQ